MMLWSFEISVITNDFTNITCSTVSALTVYKCITCIKKIAYP